MQPVHAGHFASALTGQNKQTHNLTERVGRFFRLVPDDRQFSVVRTRSRLILGAGLESPWHGEASINPRDTDQLKKWLI